MKLKIIGPNQTSLHFDEMIVFFSYETPVAAIVQMTSGLWKMLTTSKRHSNTTTKHINKFVDENKFLVQGITEHKEQEYFDNLRFITILPDNHF